MQGFAFDAPIDGTQRRSAPTFFFLVALGLTWSLQLPAVLAQRGVIPGPVDSYMLPAVLGGFGPLVAAVLAARREAGRAGIRALFESLRSWSAGAHGYIAALLVFPAIYVAGVAVYKALGEGDTAHWLYLPENPQHLAAMLIIPIAEEPGWRGFALPRLQERMGRIQASLLLGVLWAAWHMMMFVLQGITPASSFVFAMVNILAGSVVFSWLYNRTRGSLLIAIVAHMGTHLNNPTHALPGNPTPFVVYTVAVCVAACGLMLADREAWRAEGPSPSA